MCMLDRQVTPATGIDPPSPRVNLPPAPDLFRPHPHRVLSKPLPAGLLGRLGSENSLGHSHPAPQPNLLRDQRPAGSKGRRTIG